MVLAKTLDEHKEYLREIVKLKLFFLGQWMSLHPDESFKDALRNRVDIFQHTSANPDSIYENKRDFDSSPAWLEMEEKLEKVFLQCKNSLAKFEAKGFEIFDQSIQSRPESDLHDRIGLRGYQCGSLRYNEYDKETEIVDFHIANALAPESIFSNPRYLPDCFMDLMKQTEEKYNASVLRTNTWLNSHPVWLKYFPNEWQRNMSSEGTNIQWHLGFWGQFITARGTFNYKVAEYLRKTGKFLYYPRMSSCSFSAMKQHLNKNFLIVAFL
jgi:hypothetical protein